MRLTETRVSQHKATDSKVYMWDLVEDGLGLETAPNGRKSWVFRYRLLGEAKRVILGQYPSMGMDAARESAQEPRSALRQGVNPALERRREKDAGSVAQLAESYQATKYFKARSKDFHAGFKSSWRRYIVPAIGDMPVEAVKRAHVRQIIDDMVDDGKEGAATSTRCAAGAAQPRARSRPGRTQSRRQG